MTPDSQATRIRLLEDQMQTVLETGRREADSMADFRRMAAETATVSATNTTRIKAVEDDISEIKGALRRLEEGCAKAVDLTELKEAMKAFGTGRHQVTLTKLSMFGVILAALISAAAVVIVAVINGAA